MSYKSEIVDTELEKWSKYIERARDTNLSIEDRYNVLVLISKRINPLMLLMLDMSYE